MSFKGWTESGGFTKEPRIRSCKRSPRGPRYALKIGILNCPRRKSGRDIAKLEAAVVVMIVIVARSPGSGAERQLLIIAQHIVDVVFDGEDSRRFRKDQTLIPTSLDEYLPLPVPSLACVVIFLVLSYPCSLSFAQIVFAVRGAAALVRERLDNAITCGKENSALNIKMSKKRSCSCRNISSLGDSPDLYIMTILE